LDGVQKDLAELFRLLDVAEEGGPRSFPVCPRKPAEAAIATSFADFPVARGRAGNERSRRRKTPARQLSRRMIPSYFRFSPLSLRGSSLERVFVAATLLPPARDSARVQRCMYNIYTYTYIHTYIYIYMYMYIIYNHMYMVYIYIHSASS